MSTTKEKNQLNGRLVEAARVLLRLTQQELADACGLARRTVAVLEKARKPMHPGTESRIREALEARGIEFLNGTGIGLRLVFSKAKQFRLSQPTATDDPTEE